MNEYKGSNVWSCEHATAAGTTVGMEGMGDAGKAERELCHRDGLSSWFIRAELTKAIEHSRMHSDLGSALQ